MRTSNGFTLIEIMIAVAVIAILFTGGSLVMYGSLGSRGQNQIEININQAGSQIMESLEQSIRFAKVESVGSSDREACLDAGQTGVGGSFVTVSDLWGSTTYAMLGGSTRIASDSAEHSLQYLSTPDVVVSDLSFTWLCVSGSYDKLRVSFSLNEAGISGVLHRRVFKRDINMYNSGI